MTPFFSIIVPVYNVEKYLDRCLDSLQKQTFADFEVVLVDDGSKDSSNAICRAWLEKDARFRLVEKKNAGLGYARNTGLDNAVGTFVVYVDSDDYLVPDALEKIHKRLEMTGADLCYYGHITYSASGMVYGTPPEKLSYTEQECDAFLHSILGPVPESTEFQFAGVAAWSGCVRRQLLEEHHIRFTSERETLCEDIVYNLQLCMHMKYFVIEPSCLYVYCINDLNSLTTRYRTDRLEACIKLRDTLRGIMVEYKDAETQERITRTFIQNLIVCLRQEAQHVKENGLRSALRRVDALCRNPEVVDAMASYPIDRMPAMQRILFTAMKWRLSPVVYALTWARYGRKIG